ncbi:hypothetical protein RFI_15469 [Reticulomyxa filosa]|uniref:Uncharacterized protein n=1 Tax=Reticulomyxa filosa TaxID=46433 RepID=X6N6Q6_RETFI|nr:hypothetical protein RFI_15469 [Reticulomyxa filosa]|eukprot:ETO21736.1 hypothetical protein RFI_15469 [Reticulomyxa filosa]
MFYLVERHFFTLHIVIAAFCKTKKKTCKTHCVLQKVLVENVNTTEEKIEQKQIKNKKKDILNKQERSIGIKLLICSFQDNFTEKKKKNYKIDNAICFPFFFSFFCLLFLLSNERANIYMNKMQTLSTCSFNIVQMLQMERLCPTVNPLPQYSQT